MMSPGMKNFFLRRTGSRERKLKLTWIEGRQLLVIIPRLLGLKQTSHRGCFIASKTENHTRCVSCPTKNMEVLKRSFRFNLNQSNPAMRL